MGAPCLAVHTGKVFMGSSIRAWGPLQVSLDPGLDMVGQVDVVQVYTVNFHYFQLKYPHFNSIFIHTDNPGLVT